MTVMKRPDIVATNAFYYYHDVEAAHAFYQQTLGFETVVDYGFAKILRLADSSYLTVVQADAGMHSADEPKNVTLHLVTDEMNRWRNHLQSQDVLIEYDETAGDAANSFVILDSGGYRLRFVRYNPHPGHAAYVAAFAAAEPVMSTVTASGDMGVRATAFSISHAIAAAGREFFESLFDVTAQDQFGGGPIYQASSSGFVLYESFAGPVPAEPGKNGMTLSFFTRDVDAWFDRASGWPGFRLRTEEVLNEGGLVRVFVGYDPHGIFLEWDTFLDVPENSALLRYLD